MAKEKKSTMLLWLAGAAAILLWILGQRSSPTGTGTYSGFLAPGAGGPAGSASGNIIAGITGGLASLAKGFTSGANAPSLSGVASAPSTNAIPSVPNFSGLGGGFATGGSSLNEFNLGSSTPAPAPAPTTSEAPQLPGLTATNDQLDMPAVTSGGGGGGLNFSGLGGGFSESGGSSLNQFALATS